MAEGGGGVGRPVARVRGLSAREEVEEARMRETLAAAFKAMEDRKKAAAVLDPWRGKLFSNQIVFKLQQQLLH